MKGKKVIVPFLLIATLAALTFCVVKFNATSPDVAEDKVTPKIRGIAKAFIHLNEMRADPKTGEVDVRDVFKARKQANQRQLSKTNCSDADNTLVWQELGPGDVGGRTRTLWIDRFNPLKLYSGGVSGGIWISENRGASWRHYDATALATLSVSAITQTLDGVIIVGTGEYYENGVSYGTPSSKTPGHGLFRSIDGGETFEQLDSTIPEAFTSSPSAVNWAFTNDLAVHPVSNQVYAATNRGLWISDDEGMNWERPANVSTASIAYDLSVGSDGVVYALVGSKVYKSQADGTSFENISQTSGLPLTSGRKRIAVAPSDPNKVYAVYLNDGCIGKVYRSTNAGSSWAVIGDGSSAGFDDPCAGHCQCWYDLALAVNPNNADQIWLGGVYMVGWRLGSGWDNVSTNWPEWSSSYVHSDIHEIVFDELNGWGYVMSDGGISICENPSSFSPSFQSLNNGFNVTQFYGMGASHEGEVMGGTQDNGTNYIVYNQDLDSYEVLGADGGYSEISNINGNIIFAETQEGYMLRSMNGGNSFNEFISSDMDLDNDGNLDSAPFITRYFLWENLEEYFYGSGAIHSKFFTGGDNGKLWMTREVLQNGTPDWEVLATFTGGSNELISVAVSSDGNNVFAVSRGGTIIRAQNIDGASPDIESNISSPLFSAGRYVTGMDVDRFNPNNLVVTAANYGRDNYVFLSTNAMANPASTVSFESIQHNLPQMPVYDVAANPDNPDYYLIVGTELGVWTYNLNTQCWSEQNTGLGRVPVFQVRLEDMRNVGCKVLYLATHGRGLFRSTTLTSSFCDTHIPLDDFVDAAPAIPSPDLAMRLYPNPMRENASINFSLAQNAKNVHLRIFDLSGKVVHKRNLGALNVGMHNLSINGNNMTAGTYLVQLEVDGNSTAMRLVVAK